MAVLRNHDLFVKARADIQTKTLAGGIVTVLASVLAFLLFVAQLYAYTFPTSVHTLHVSESTQFHMLHEDRVDPFHQKRYELKGKIPLVFKITFLHLDCTSLEVKFNSQVIDGDDFSGRKITNHHRKKKQRPSAAVASTSRQPTVRKYPPKTLERRNIFGSEHTPEAKLHQHRGCTIEGKMRVPMVAGSLSLTLTSEAWAEAMSYFLTRARLMQNDERAKSFTRENAYNMTHYIHEVRFGRPGGDAFAGPLKDKLNKIQNEMKGVALEQITIKLIPTLNRRPGLFSTLFGTGQRPYYQHSVVDYTLNPETMVGASSSLPGIAMAYDVTPLAVHINAPNPVDDTSFFSFLATLIGIVGGCFVTIRLFAGCAVSSVQAVAKKMD